MDIISVLIKIFLQNSKFQAISKWPDKTWSNHPYLVYMGAMKLFESKLIKTNMICCEDLVDLISSISNTMFALWPICVRAFDKCYTIFRYFYLIVSTFTTSYLDRNYIWSSYYGHLYEKISIVFKKLKILLFQSSKENKY